MHFPSMLLGAGLVLGWILLFKMKLREHAPRLRDGPIPLRHPTHFDPFMTDNSAPAPFAKEA